MITARNRERTCIIFEVWVLSKWTVPESHVTEDMLSSKEIKTRNAVAKKFLSEKKVAFWASGKVLCLECGNEWNKTLYAVKENERMTVALENVDLEKPVTSDPEDKLRNGVLKTIIGKERY